MMTEDKKQGELYKLLKEYQFHIENADILTPDLEGKIVNDVTYDMDAVNSETVQKFLDAAKADFPKYPQPLPEKEFTKEKWCALLDAYDSQVAVWFKKWFGEK